MGDVIYGDFQTTLDIPVDRVLDCAREENLDSAIVVGMHEDGALFYASTTGNIADMILLLERMKASLLKILEGAP